MWSEPHFTYTLISPHPRMPVSHCLEDSKEGDDQGKGSAREINRGKMISHKWEVICCRYLRFCFTLIYISLAVLKRI